MSSDLVPVSSIAQSPTQPTRINANLSDRLRHIVTQLRQEGEVQIKATSRILGAAAQIAENHDRLIDEVVDMVEEDLNQPSPSPLPALSEAYTVERLKQQFGKFQAAKDHFGVKASSWANLVDKLNQPITTPPQKPHSHLSHAYKSRQDSAIDQRLAAIEAEIQAMRGDINRILTLLEHLVLTRE
ncbi:hypothetical protein [Thermocoleostomius sinensis]|uniref:Uncharacterized protein n=1 Tax=Thermocoleostomius sinensis A174 TaxID=2016057 RepID=A0A9E9CA41_9CYAN|nr:hypothetical protein [Thermocoleostomius sinensis]WAL60467.1 hypothetical protein OXH18_00295 [Thermocoleostomius sinensis A174]